MAGRSKDIILDTSITVERAMIRADEYLELLLSNILMNSVEHNPKPIKRVWVALKDDGDGFLISIGDNGPGISDARKSELFDVARRFGGIGLHQSSQILEKYEGWIQVHDRIKSQPQEGAEFKLWFPKPAIKNGKDNSKKL
jgi:signal transduction histidine kinase